MIHKKLPFNGDSDIGVTRAGETYLANRKDEGRNVGEGILQAFRDYVFKSEAETVKIYVTTISIEKKKISLVNFVLIYLDR